MRLLGVAFCLVGLALSAAPSAWAQASDPTVYQGERPARALLIRAGLLDTTAAQAEEPTAEDPSAEAPTGRVLHIDPTPLFYVVQRGAVLRAVPDDRAAVVERLSLREGVRLLSAETPGGTGWWHVRSSDGTREGYVRAEALSNVWIRVDKSERTVYVYRGTELLHTLPADVSAGTGDKVRRSRVGETEHYRIPEGTFFVAGRNEASQYYRAFVINYPNTEHAERGLRDGLISRVQFEAIAAAERAGLAPPMGTPLGGLIEIHGSGSGRRRAWTRGCVALRNVHMDDLWEIVQVGTPVVIEP